MGDVIHALPLAENARAARRDGRLGRGDAVLGAARGQPQRRSRLRRRHASVEAAAPAPPTRAGTSAACAGRSGSSLRTSRSTRRGSGSRRSSRRRRALSGHRLRALRAPRARRPPSSARSRSTPAAAAPHVVDRNLALLEAAGDRDRVARAGRRVPRARFRAPEADAFLAVAAASLRRSSTRAPAGPRRRGARSASRTWPRGLDPRARHRPPSSRGGPGDERRAERLRALLPEAAADAACSTSRVSRASIRASALFVAGDTGPLHLADALGVPTLALFGPTDPARNGPYRDRRGIVTRMHDVSGRHRAGEGVGDRCVETRARPRRSRFELIDPSTPRSPKTPTISRIPWPSNSEISSSSRS